MYKYVKDKTEQKYFETVCDNTNDSSFEYLDVEQSEVDGKWYLPEECPHDTPEEKARKERERLNKLSLTKREVFLALYNDKGITPEAIKEYIKDPESLIEFEYANDYFRGNPLIDAIGQTLGYSSEQLDYLFIHKEFPEKEEPTEEINETTTDNNI